MGAACAEALAEAGVRVTVLESHFAGGGATAAAMGHVLVMDDPEAQLALTAWSRRLWASARPSCPPTARTSAAARCGWRRARARWRSPAPGPRSSPRTGSRPRCSTRRPSARRSLTCAPGSPARCACPTIASSIPRARRASSSRVRGGTAPRCARAPAWRRWPRAAPRRDGSWLEADVVVVAAGADARRLLPGLPVVPRKGHLVITDRHPGLVRHQVVELGYLASAPRSRRRVGGVQRPAAAHGAAPVGSSRELVGWDPSFNRALRARMLRRAAEYLPALGAPAGAPDLGRLPARHPRQPPADRPWGSRAARRRRARGPRDHDLARHGAAGGRSRPRPHCRPRPAPFAPRRPMPAHA